MGLRCILLGTVLFSNLLSSGIYDERVGSRVMCRDCNPGIPESRDPGNFPIPKSRVWAALNPGISGLTKFIYLTVFLVLFKIILCIYSFFDVFLSPQWGGEGAVVLGRTCDRTRWLSGAQKLTSEFPTFACVDYVIRLPVIVRLAQECNRPTFV